MAKIHLREGGFHPKVTTTEGAYQVAGKIYTICFNSHDEDVVDVAVHLVAESDNPGAD